MSLDTMLPGLKPSFTKKGLGASLLSGGLLPPVTSRTSSDALGITKPPAIKLPGTPTIDDAREQQQESDRIRKRRGAFANIFGGSNYTAPAVGTRTLLGA